MSGLGPHASFIIGSYAASIAVLGALILWVARDSRARKRELEALEARRTGESRAPQGHAGESRT
jgi:heme exporter protein D